MKHTKDEIEITITKKDRVYLSIILSLICVVAIVCILVPRYYQLQNNPTLPPTSSQTGNSNNTDTNNSTQDVSLNNIYQNAYTTMVLNKLKPLGMPYSTLSNYLDSFNILDVVGLNINSSQLDNLEMLSLPIHEAFTDYTNNNIQITTSLINANDQLHSQIVALSNAFTQILQR